MISPTLAPTIQFTLVSTLPSAGGTVVSLGILFNGQPLVFNGANLTYNES